MAGCVYYVNSTDLKKTSGLVPDDCNHIVQTRQEYDDTQIIITNHEATITDLENQIATSGGSSTTVELSATSIQALEDTFTDALITFDPDVMAALTYAMFAGIAAGWSGGIILSMIRKGRR